MADHIAARLHAPGPKRVLALDGGGTRGIVTLMFLEEMEKALREKLRIPSRQPFVLSDYFDLIGGTSVGSMIATLLAAGKSASHIRELFEMWAPHIFTKTSRGFLYAMYNDDTFKGLVRTEVFDWTLGTEHLKTGLCIVAKRSDTGSVWPINNNPAGPYYRSRPAGDGNSARRGNAEFKLLDLIRASTAAPRYFSPQDFSIFDGVDQQGNAEQGRFIDGGVSPFNNPSLQLFMMAGMRGYNFGGGPVEPRSERKAWKLGAENLLMISVGTGSFSHEVERSGIAAWEAVGAVQGVMSDAQELGLALLQWMSRPPRGWTIDRVIGDLQDDLLGEGAGFSQPLLSFQRYDMRLDQRWLKDHCGASIERPELEKIRDFTNPDSISRLRELAKTTARKQVVASDFPDAFDAVWKAPSRGTTSA